MKKWIFLFCCYFSTAHAGSYSVSRILSADTLEISNSAPGLEVIQVGTIFMIQSQDKRETVGFARVEGVNDGGRSYLAQVRAHTNSGLIRIHDPAVVADLTQRDQNLKGRFDLMSLGDKNSLALYKPLVYLGPTAGQTAALLERGEWFLGPGMVGRGISHSFQLDTVPFLNVVGEANLEAKYNFLEGADYRVSGGMKGSYNFQLKKAVGEGEIYWDTFSTSKFITYNRLHFITGGSDLTNNQVAVDLSVNSGYLLDDWDEVVFGPNVNIHQKTLGGFLAYYWTMDKLTVSISAYSSDFLNLKINANGYLFLFDFWWRL